MQKLTSKQVWERIKKDKTLRFFAPKTASLCGEIIEWVDGEPVEVVLGKNKTFAFDIGSCYPRDDWTEQSEETKELA